MSQLTRKQAKNAILTVFRVLTGKRVRIRVTLGRYRMLSAADKERYELMYSQSSGRWDFSYTDHGYTRTYIDSEGDLLSVLLIGMRREESSPAWVAQKEQELRKALAAKPYLPGPKLILPPPKTVL